MKNYTTNYGEHYETLDGRFHVKYVQPNDSSKFNFHDPDKPTKSILLMKG